MPAKVIPREHWSKIGFLLAAIGSAVGLGNIWRFPYMVGSNGGGAFLIPYVVGAILFGLPMMMLELEAGRKYKGSVVTTLKQINKKVWPLGLLGPLVSIAILTYYGVIAGWTFGYFVFSFTGYMEFSQFTNSLLPLLFFIITLVIMAFIVSKGVKGGIEKASIILMPILFVILVLLAIYSLFLPGASEGLKFYLTPDFGALLNPNTWLMGISQAFFSMSVGYGILLTYASYLDPRSKIGESALGIAAADTIIALLAGLIIFPIVFSFGMNPAAGAELTFITLPAVFSTMPFGMFIGIAFFFLLFIAALTSGVSIFEMGIANFIDELKWTRKKSVLLLTGVFLIGGIPNALSYYGAGISLFGMPYLDFIDTFLATLLSLSASLLCISIVWFHKPEVFYLKMEWAKKIRAGDIVVNFLKFVVPFVLIILFLIEVLSKLNIIAM